ncbi:MAG: thioredoxin-disulfide reductase [Kiritimatiellae bacterium]|jgi:thioredoxin reductase (NADPH)|nr:thioredoxin-disulfide reductase [Kiritimatiellia bacterium]
MEKIIIAGSGPAGLTAAIYAARSGLEPLVLEGMQPGGQLTQTEVVENFPGFPDGIDANELMARMKRQAERFGARFQMDEMTGVARTETGVAVDCMVGGRVETVALIVATGATARKLGLESEAKLTGRGVSGCAVCDGAFYKGKAVAVIGGGDTAMGDALYLARICTEVTVVHRRDEFRASKVMADRVLANPKIKVAWNSVVEEILGVEQRAVRGIRLRNKITGEISDVAVSGVFVAIGHAPSTAWANGLLDLDEEGYIKSANALTNVPGIFVAGDVQDRINKQAVTAAASGCAAALAAERYVDTVVE